MGAVNFMKAWSPVGFPILDRHGCVCTESCCSTSALEDCPQSILRPSAWVLEYLPSHGFCLDDSLETC
jgi:hypothetical protein